jgi:hypothetical protein
MTATDEALAQLDALLSEYASHRVQQPRPDSAGSLMLIQRFLAAIDRLTVPTSTYAQAAARQAGAKTCSLSRLMELAAVVTALREDINSGWMASVTELAHADTYAGYLEMAEGLSGQGYKDAAAVIAGTSLEVCLKALATKHGVSLQLPSGAPKKMDAVNAELKAAGVYNALEHKQVTAWLAIRNSAAHGDYGDYDDAAVKAMVEGVGGFAGKHPA